jgi:hypothetical protein
MIRDDVPQDLIRNKIMPLIENGGTAWKVIGSDDVQAEEMLKTIVPTPEPVVIEEPEPETIAEEVVEEVVEVEEPAPSPPVSDEEVNVDILLAASGFDSSLTRAQMMSWCSEKGLAVSNRSTKASLTDQAREFVTGASE